MAAHHIFCRENIHVRIVGSGSTLGYQDRTIKDDATALRFDLAQPGLLWIDISAIGDRRLRTGPRVQYVGQIRIKVTNGVNVCIPLV